jgi:protein-L-isoaspartate(D-aspartate) O-methyltransferase
MTSLRIRQRLVQRLWDAGIRNESVLEAFLKIPRHLFVEEALASRAYADTSLPIGFGQTISQPYIVARMTEALVEGREVRKALEIGTGSGYQAAVLSFLVAQVYSIERIRRFAERAGECLRAVGRGNVRVKHGDGSLGWPDYAPYDGILITAASQEIPVVLLKQLTLGGRLLAPVGTPQAQELIQVDRKADGFEQQSLGPVTFVPLLGGVL